MSSGESAFINSLFILFSCSSENPSGFSRASSPSDRGAASIILFVVFWVGILVPFV